MLAVISFRLPFIIVGLMLLIVARIVSRHVPETVIRSRGPKGHKNLSDG